MSARRRTLKVYGVTFAIVTLLGLMSFAAGQVMRMTILHLLK